MCTLNGFWVRLVGTVSHKFDNAAYFKGESNGQFNGNFVYIGDYTDQSYIFNGHGFEKILGPLRPLLRVP